MAPITPGEIRPGLVVHLDPAILIAAGGCATNAMANAEIDRAVQDKHYFLVVHVDPEDGAALAVPLYSHESRGSVLLDEGLKDGKAGLWKDQPSYFSPWQHWWIPALALVAGSTEDDSEPGTRRTYAAERPAELSDIADSRLTNPAPWRGLA